ncbi:MAG: hypothetical protein AAF431_08665 [Pseudomonadota bacterium]
MSIFQDIKQFGKDMSTLPWYIQVWATMYPLPQLLGGLYFIQTLPGAVILLGRILSTIVASQVHKGSPFSKLIGPVSHAHWLLILPYLAFVLATQQLEAPLFYFICYVVVTSCISAVIDIRDYLNAKQQGETAYKR